MNWFQQKVAELKQALAARRVAKLPPPTRVGDEVVPPESRVSRADVARMMRTRNSDTI